MAIPLSVPSADAIPQGLASHYVPQADGSFRLDVEGALPAAELAGLQKTLHAERTRAGQLESELKKIKTPLEGIEDLEAFRREAEASKEELAQLRDVNKDVTAKVAEMKASMDASWKQRVDQLEAGHKKKLEDAATELGRLQEGIRREKLLNLVSTSEILKKTMFAELPAPMALGALNSLGSPFEVVEQHGAFVVTAKDQYGNPFLSPNGQPAQGEEALKLFLETHPQRDQFFKASAGGSGSQGGGASGGGTKNPWKKDSFNLTEQGRILKENPELARRLKAEAGVR